MIVEAITIKVAEEKRKAQRQEEARQHRASHRKLADPATRGAMTG